MGSFLDVWLKKNEERLDSSRKRWENLRIFFFKDGRMYLNVDIKNLIEK